MRPKLRIASLLLALSTLYLFGCPARVPYDPNLAELVKSSMAGAAVGPGDIFEVRVYREQDLSGFFQVAPDGTVEFPLIGSLAVSGLTSSDIARLVREKLADGYLKSPYVTVNIKEFLSKRVYVLGQVEKPGTFRYEDGMSVIQVITLAGGFTKTARPNDVVVTRVDGDRELRSVVPVNDISEGRARNFYLRPGDIVFVPESIL
jgi:polysaccharide export outer membrane protein